MGKIQRLRSIRGKLIFYFVSLVLGITLVIGFIQYNTTSKQILNLKKEQVVSLALAASTLIDGDSHEKLVSKEDEDTDSFKEIRAKMQEFQKTTGVNYIYTLVKSDSADTTKFVIDASEEDTAELGYEYQYLESMGNAFNGTASSDEQLTTDEWGTFLSGYAPIKNSAGKVVAIVGVDIDAGRILVQQKQLLQNIALNTTCSIVLALLLAVFFSGRIAKPITFLVKRFRELSKTGGDLTQKIQIKTGDELQYLGEAVTEFITYIRETVVHISDTADGVKDSAEGLNHTISQNLNAVEEVSSSVEGISSRASELAESVNDISLMIQNIATDINVNEKNIDNMNSLVESTRNLIDNGLSAVEHQNIKTEQSMTVFSKASFVVEKLAKEAKDVENILATITEIAEQSNLLAINASIEAAKAGEQGRGFSIVAQEVRKLAIGSSDAVHEIAQILDIINTDAGEAINEMQNMNVIAREQKTAVDNTNITFQNMATGIEGMIGNVENISKSMKGIASNTNLIAKKIDGISAVSEKNAEIAEEVTASSEEQNAAMEDIGSTADHLSGLSLQLKEKISQFII